MRTSKIPAGGEKRKIRRRRERVVKKKTVGNDKSSFEGVLGTPTVEIPPLVRYTHTQTHLLVFINKGHAQNTFGLRFYCVALCSTRGSRHDHADGTAVWWCFSFCARVSDPFIISLVPNHPPPLTPDTVVPRTERVFEGFERVSKWPWGARRSSGAHAQPRVYVLHTRPMVHALVHENIKTTHVGVYKYYTGKPADRTSTRIIPSILRLPTTIFRR